MPEAIIDCGSAECSKTSNRGLLICIEGGIIAIGKAIAYWIDFGAHYGPDDLVWRFPIAFQIVFGIVIIVGMWYLPDSPHYLISKDRIEEGEYVLAALAGCEVHDRETQVQKQLVLDSLRASGALGQKTSFRDLLTGGPSQHLRRMLVTTAADALETDTRIWRNRPGELGIGTANRAPAEALHHGAAAADGNQSFAVYGS